MKNMTILRLLALILAIIMLTTLLAGCKKAGSADEMPAPETTEPSDVPEESPTPSAAPEKPNKPEEPKPSRTPVEESEVEGTFGDEENEVSYSAEVGEEEFTYIELKDGTRYFAEERDDVFMDVRFIEGKTAAKVKPSFMDDYVNFDKIRFAGENPVGETDIMGIMITAQNGDVGLEAWLIDMNGGVLAVVISYTQENKDSQMERLYAVLDTFKIEGSQELS